MSENEFAEDLAELVPRPPGRHTRRRVDRVGLQRPVRENAPRLEGTIRERISEVVLRKEEASGMNRGAFIAHLGIKSRPSYYGLIEGSLNLSLNALEDLADRLGISIYELLGVPHELVAESRELSSVATRSAVKARGASEKKAA